MTEPTAELVDAQVKILKQAKLRELMERAKGRKLFQWTDLLLIIFVAIFIACFVFFASRSERFPADAFSLYMVLILLHIFQSTRTQRRFDAIAELLEANEGR